VVRGRTAAPALTARASRADGAEAWAALRDAGWDRLVEAADADPHLRTAVLARPDPLAPAVTPRALLVRRGPDLVAGAALGALRVRGLVRVGHLVSPHLWLEPTPPARDGRAVDALADALLAEPGDVLALRDLPADAPLVEALRRRCPGMRVVPAAPSWLARPGLDGRGVSKRRREARRAVRRAEERFGPVRVEVLREASAIAAVAPDLVGLAARSREGRPCDAYLAEAAGRRHRVATLATLAEEGRVRVVTVDVGGELAAFYAGVISGTAAYAVLTGADRRGGALTGMGWVGLLGLLDALDAEDLTGLELGPGGDDHKRGIAEERPLVDVQAPLSRAGRAYLWVAGRARRRGAAPGTPDRSAETRAGATGDVDVVRPAR